MVAAVSARGEGTHRIETNLAMFGWDPAGFLFCGRRRDCRRRCSADVREVVDSTVLLLLLLLLLLSLSLWSVDVLERNRSATVGSNEDGEDAVLHPVILVVLPCLPFHGLENSSSLC